MQRHGERLFWQHIDPTTLPHSWETAEVAFPSDHHNPFLGGELPDAMSRNKNLSPTRVEGLFANATQPEDAELQVLTEWMDKPQEYHLDNNPTNLTLAHVAPGTMPSFQLPSSDVPSSDSRVIPIVHLEDRSFRCSWYSHDSAAQCYYVAPDRPTFLRHLGVEHQVSGHQEAMIICRLFDSKTGSSCSTPIKRGNFPRHADTHYHVRYYCQHCPAGKSFSRQDSWKKHIRSMHA